MHAMHALQQRKFFDLIRDWSVDNGVVAKIVAEYGYEDDSLYVTLTTAERHVEKYVIDQWGAVLQCGGAA